MDNADVILEDVLGVSAYRPQFDEKSGGKGDEKKSISEECFTEEERKVLEAVPNDPVYIDDIVAASGVVMPRCIAALITLRKKGVIAETERGYYHRVLKK